MNTTEIDPLTLAETRATRLAMVMDGYEVQDEPDGSVPYAARVEYVDAQHNIPRKHPRYVLVTQYGDKGNYRVHLAGDRPGVESLAAHLATTADGAESIVCYFDLDELAGEEPMIYEDDVVEYGGVQYTVNRVDEELAEGEVARYLYLLEGRKAEDWDDYDHRVHQDDVEIVERAEEDERMPVRYGVAKVVVSVIFNTVPSP